MPTPTPAHEAIFKVEQVAYSNNDQSHDISSHIPPGNKLRYAYDKVQLTYYIPSPLHIQIAIHQYPDESRLAILQSTHPNHLEDMNSIEALKTVSCGFAYPALQNIITDDLLANTYLILDLRTSDHVKGAYMADEARIAEHYRTRVDQWHFQFCRKVEVIVPFLCQDTYDITNFRYGSVKLVFTKGDYGRAWKVGGFEPYVVTEEHTTSEDLDDRYYGFLKYLQVQIVKMLPVGILTADALGEMQYHVTSIVYSASVESRWMVVRVGDVMERHRAHVVRRDAKRDRFRLEGGNKLEYPRAQGMKSE